MYEVNVKVKIYNFLYELSVVDKFNICDYIWNKVFMFRCI